MSILFIFIEPMKKYWKGKKQSEGEKKVKKATILFIFIILTSTENFINID